MYDIFLIFTMKKHPDVSEFDNEDDDDRRRRLQVRNSPIFLKNVLLNIEKINQEIEGNELW
jgi:hypothetical protein